MNCRKIDRRHFLKSSVLVGTSTISYSAFASGGRAPRYRPKLIQAVQLKLNERGYRAGPVDGIIGRRTIDATVTFKKDNDLSLEYTIDNDLNSIFGSNGQGVEWAITDDLLRSLNLLAANQGN